VATRYEHETQQQQDTLTSTCLSFASSWLNSRYQPSNRCPASKQAGKQASNWMRPNRACSKSFLSQHIVVNLCSHLLPPLHGAETTVRLRKLAAPLGPTPQDGSLSLQETQNSGCYPLEVRHAGLNALRKAYKAKLSSHDGLLAGSKTRVWT
jgi:hypothetical protein